MLPLTRDGIAVALVVHVLKAHGTEFLTTDFTDDTDTNPREWPKEAHKAQNSF
jgi:hypothetical protein